MRLIDVAIGMLAIARDKLEIALIQGSAEALPLADEIVRTILKDSA
jgi:ubiquinone/menaquinone biosynthesis C-methylase UbiE